MSPRAQKPKGKGRILFFGYGRLMFCNQGLNGRGMRHQYVDDELAPCKLSGYRRGGLMSVAFNVGRAKRTFYSIVQNKKHSMNGVIFEIHSNRDLHALLVNEGANERNRGWRCYDVVEVTDKIKGFNLQPGDKVFTLKNPKGQKASEKVMFPPYVACVYNGIAIWGDKFREEFLATGGESP